MIAAFDECHGSGDTLLASFCLKLTKHSHPACETLQRIAALDNGPEVFAGMVKAEIIPPEVVAVLRQLHPSLVARLEGREAA